MTAQEIIDAVKEINGESDIDDTTLFNFIKLVIRELVNLTNPEDKRFIVWKWLEATTTYQTENGVFSIAFSASKWPAAALTNYSRNMRIVSSASNGDGGSLELSSVDILMGKKLNFPETGVPREFAIFNNTLYLHKTPITGSLPLLTLYYQKILDFTNFSTSSDMTTFFGIKESYHVFFIDAILAKVFSRIGDTREVEYKERWYKQHIPVMILDNSLE